MSTIVWPATLPLKVEATFGSTVVDLYPFFLKQEIRITFGAQNENSAVQAGTIAFEIDNPDSDFTPDHPMSQYWPYIQLGVPIQVSVYWNGAWHIRFTGEASEWKPYWPFGDLSDEAKGRKGEARVAVVASGILRRLAQGKSPQRSAEFRTMAGLSEGLGGVLFTPLAYIPGEDGVDATQLSSGLPGGVAATFTGPATFASDGPTGSAPLIRAGAGFRAVVPIPSYVSTNQWEIVITFNVPAEPVATTTLMEVPLTPGGTVAKYRVDIVPGSPAQIQWNAFDSGGAALAAQSIQVSLSGVNERPSETTFFDEDNWFMMSFAHHLSGGNATATVVIADGVDASITTGAGSAGTVAALSDQIILTADSNLDGVGIGHLGVYVDTAVDPGLADDLGPSMVGWAGEWVQTRLERLAREFDIPLTITGSSTKEMGPQQIDTIYNLFAACAQVDVGILHEDREALGLVYRTNRSLYNQTAALTLSARRNEITGPYRPTLDDLNVRNDVIVQRLGGAEYRSLIETGPKSALPPPNGVGTYDEKLILNLYADAQTVYNATWRTWRGTWPGMRYPRISPDINASPDIAEDWIAAGIGDRIDVTDLPPQHPRAAVESLLRGYAETLRPTGWDVTVNATPAGPYEVGQAGNGSNAGAWTQTGPATALTNEMKPGDTTVTVTIDGALFDTTANLTLNPLELYVDGDVHTVTAISGAGPTQTFTVQRTYPQLRRAAGTIVKVNNPLIASW